MREATNQSSRRLKSPMKGWCAQFHDDWFHAPAPVTDGVSVCAAEGLRGPRGQRAPRGHDALGDGERRDRASARSSRSPERGVHDGDRAVAGRDSARVAAGRQPGDYRKHLLRRPQLLAGAVPPDQRDRRHVSQYHLSRLRPPLPSGGGPASGGIVGYPLERLREEVAFIAYYFHWADEAVLNLEHAERRQWVDEISKINRKVGGTK